MARLEKLITFAFLTIFLHHPSVLAITAADLLPPEQAFQVSATSESPDSITARWRIAEGYYLYRSKLRFVSKTPDIRLGEARLPKGKIKHDEFFGEMETYRDHLEASIPLVQRSDGPLVLEITHQGCADAGVCYPPQKTTLTVELTPQESAASSGAGPLERLAGGLESLGLDLFQQGELLPADEAFRFFADTKDPSTLHVSWQIADGYYLYREKFKFSLEPSKTLRLGDYAIPRGTPEEDEAFGRVEIFHDAIAFDLPLIRTGAAPQKVALTAFFQGCADRGVCYPPMQKTVELELPAMPAAATTGSPVPPAMTPVSEQDGIAAKLKGASIGLTVVSFFGFGLLLSFTPCVLPMIPILSGIIVGRGQNLTARRGFVLSLSYVVASAAMYTVFGVLAGLFGSNLQATFQNPWVIGTFSGVFVLLALSMFGFFNLEVPKALQSRLHRKSDRHRDGSIIGTAIMGALSALIVGPCVAAPLAGALIYIGQTGDAVLGGVALFFLGIGMGFPLLLLGASAGKLLPKAGPWMNATKAVFGVLMLAVAVWLLDRILPATVTMALWALLLIIPAIFMNAVDTLPENASGWRRLWKGVGIVMLTYGILLLIGVTAGNSNPLKPLEGISVAGGATVAADPLEFRRIKSSAELDRVLAVAGTRGQWVMLDFYADWCISCKEMEHYTFTDPEVKRSLADVALVQADVTENSEIDQALLKRFNLIGPPAILFFGPDRVERTAQRVIGFKDAASFTDHLRQVIQ